MRTRRRLLSTVFVSATLVLLPGHAATWSGEWPGFAEAASSGGQQGGRSGESTGTRLHDGAKTFGDSLLGGLKYTGRKIGEFFSDSDGTERR